MKTFDPSNRNDIFERITKERVRKIDIKFPYVSVNFLSLLSAWKLEGHEFFTWL